MPPIQGQNSNFNMGSASVMDHFIPFCRNMGLEIEGREMLLLAFIASSEANRKMGRTMLFAGEDRKGVGGRKPSHEAHY